MSTVRSSLYTSAAAFPTQPLPKNRALPPLPPPPHPLVRHYTFAVARQVLRQRRAKSVNNICAIIDNGDIINEYIRKV